MSCGTAKDGRSQQAASPLSSACNATRGSSPARRARSMAASVKPARCSTPPLAAHLDGGRPCEVDDREQATAHRRGARGALRRTLCAYLAAASTRRGLSYWAQNPP